MYHSRCPLSLGQIHRWCPRYRPFFTSARQIMSSYLQTVARNQIAEAETSRRMGLFSEAEFQLEFKRIKDEYRSNLDLWQRTNGLSEANALRSRSEVVEKKPASGDTRLEQVHRPAIERIGATSTLSDAMKRLNALTGLKAVKEQVQDLVAFVQIQKARDEFGVDTPKLTKHLVFTGNPGTGKTTVARIIGQIYCALGMLEKADVIEVDRSGLVGGYVGQTALKTSEVIKRAIGGTLFIDEAYTLSTGGEHDFGREAVDTLLKAMEDRRDDLLVIVAGYTKEIDAFLTVNPGLRSRFSTRIHFDDYTVDELMEIWDHQLESFEYRTNPAIQSSVKAQLHEHLSRKEPNFANARFIRNLFEKTVKAHARRVSRSASLDRDALCKIECEDIEAAFKQM